MFDWLFGGRKRNQEFLMDMMKAAASGERLAHLRSALSTIGRELPADPQDAVVEAVSGLVLHLVGRAGSTVRDSDALYVAGLFSFAAANHFSYRCAVSFELTASAAVADLVDADQYVQTHDAMIRDYNAMAEVDAETLKAIGQTIARWEAEPSMENLDRLEKLFGLCLTHAKKPK